MARSCQPVGQEGNLAALLSDMESNRKVLSNQELTCVLIGFLELRY